MIKVMVVDDQTIFRESIKIILKQDDDIEVVGVAGNGQEAFEKCSTLNPEIILMDIMMPECDGIEGTRLIKEAYDNIKIIMLTTIVDEEKISMALKNGADGYVLKDILPEQLIQAIKNCKNGLNVMQEQVMETMVRRMALGGGSKERDKRLDVLTDRELEVAVLVGRGLSNKEIAEEIFVSEGRARNIVSAVLQKLDFKDRVQLAVFAAKNGLV